MAVISVWCPSCKKDQVVKPGISDENKQRYQCKNKDCSKNTFLLHYSRHGDLPEIKQK